MLSADPQPFPWNPFEPKPLSLSECQDILSQREAILESITDGFLLLDREWRFVFVNREAVRLLRQSKEALIGAQAWERFPEIVGTEVEHACRGVMENRTPVALEYPYSEPRRWFDVRAFPADVGVAVFFRDITRRKRMEEAMQRNEEFLRSVFESVKDYAIFTIDLQRCVTSWNPGAERVFGWRESEIVGRSGDILYTPEDLAKRAPETEVSTAMECGCSDDDRWHVRKDGSRFFTDGAVRPMRDADGNVTGFVKVARDVTEQRAATEASRQQMQLLDLAHDAILGWELDGAISYWNRSAEELYGFSQEEAVGRISHDLLRTSQPGGGEPFLLALQRDGRWSGELHQTTRDGRRLVVDSRIVLFRKPDGRAVVLETNRDITERKQLEAEIQQRERALRSASQRKDEFLAMLAHELRNPLGAVRNATMVLERSKTESDREWAMGVVLRQVGQLAGLVDDLLDVSRITMGKIRLEKRRIDAVAAITNAVESAWPLISERGHQLIRHDGSAQPLWVDADPIRLEQIILNLLTNAAKYTERGGVITVGSAREDNEVVVRVNDTGMGITPENLQDMFGLFVQGERSLARSEGGLGLGLTIVRQLADMHGGRVEASSEGLGKGSEFTLRLPAAPGPASPSAQKSGSPAPSRPASAHGARILIVEDNVDSATALTKLLRIQGHTVETAYDGPAAIELAKQFKPEVVLLDIGLPGLDGYEVAKRFRAESCCGSALLVAVSGYGQEEDQRRAREAGFDQHLVKPIDHERLKQILSSWAAGSR